MVRQIRHHQVSVGIERQATRIGHRRRCDCHTIGRARTPALDAVVARVHDVHASEAIEGDRGWIAELIRPRSSDTRLTSNERAIRCTYV